MKLIHKSKLSYRLLILCVVDIIVIFWIIWNEGRIQYEPLLDYNHAADAKTLPLISETYDVIIITIIANIIVMIIEIRKKYTKIKDKFDLSILALYVVMVIGCFLGGYSYISSRMDGGVIDSANSLFKFPILLFGKDTFTSIVTAMNLYLILYVFLGCTCIIYVIRCLSTKKINKCYPEGAEYGGGG